MFALFAVSLDLLVGVTGLPSLGHAGYFGAGAYAAGWVSINVTAEAPVPLLAGLGGGGAGRRAHRLDHGAQPRGVLPDAHPGHRRDAAAGGRLLGVGHRRRQRPDRDPRRPARRARRWPTPASPTGTCSPSSSSGSALVWLVARSPFGDGAARHPGQRAADARARLRHALGYKYAVFVIAGGVAGLAGSLLAAQQRLVTPADLGFATASFALLAVIIGGAGSLWGACLGAALVIAHPGRARPEPRRARHARARPGVRAGGLPAPARVRPGCGWRGRRTVAGDRAALHRAQPLVRRAEGRRRRRSRGRRRAPGTR